MSIEAPTLTEFGETQVSKTKVKVLIGTANDPERSAIVNHSCNANTYKLALVKTDMRVYETRILHRRAHVSGSNRFVAALLL